jgi:ribosomal protein L40E
MDMETKLCPHCDAKNPIDIIYCVSCGANLKHLKVLEQANIILRKKRGK